MNNLTIENLSPEQQEENALLNSSLERLQHGDEETRCYAAWGFTTRGKLPEKVILALIRALEDTAASVTSGAVEALSYQKEFSDTTVLALTDMLLRSQNQFARIDAASILGLILGAQETSSETITKNLIEALQDPCPQVRKAVIDVFEAICCRQETFPDPVIQALNEGLQDKEPSVRRKVARALACCGTQTSRNRSYDDAKIDESKEGMNHVYNK